MRKDGKKDWTGNGNSIFKTLGASNHTDKEREKNDYYATDPVAIDKLLTKIDLPKRVLEPSCGEGHLSKRLEELGYVVISYDLVDRGYGEIQNFFELLTSPFYGEYAIVTNPPYSVAKDFVLHSLELLPMGCKCCMFLKTTFLEGKARYNEIFKNTPPHYVLQFSERILCAKNGEFEKMKAGGGSAVAYAWFVWEKGYKGQTIIDWI